MTTRSHRTDKPNLVVVLPDQLAPGWMGCYGSPSVATPHFDAFARQSVRFDRAYSACPLCTPFRATLLTARYPFQTGVTENGFRLPSSEVTLAHHFNAAGYATSYVGKWHLSGRATPICLDGMWKFADGGQRWVPPAERGGFRQFIGWESGHVDHWRGLVWEDDPDRATVLPGHETDGMTDIVCERLEQLRDEPFCLFAAYQAPHPPCSPPPELLEEVRRRPLVFRPNVQRLDRRYRVPEWDYDVDVRAFADQYRAEIVQLDQAFGRLLAKIGELGLEENTIVVLLSDHGEMAGSHGLFGKAVMYEESARIPLIIRLPRGPRGIHSRALVSSVDLLPTFLELCGLPPAEDAEGLSYGPLLRGEAMTERTSLYTMYRDLSIITGRHKLVTDLWGRTPLALYDLDADPYELRNLAGEPGQASLVAKLQRDLARWLDDALNRVGRPLEAFAKPAHERSEDYERLMSALGT